MDAKKFEQVLELIGSRFPGAAEALRAHEASQCEALAIAKVAIRTNKQSADEYERERDTAQAQLLEAAHLLERATSVVEQRTLASDILRFLAKYEDRHVQAARLESGHGHVTPRADGFRARCGGPGMCSVCKAEQEVQAAQAGDELDAMAEAIFNADKDNWFSVGPYPQLHANDKARLRAMARAALATQSAAKKTLDEMRQAKEWLYGYRAALTAASIEFRRADGTPGKVSKRLLELRRETFDQPAVRGAEHG